MEKLYRDYCGKYSNSEPFCMNSKESPELMTTLRCVLLKHKQVEKKHYIKFLKMRWQPSFFMINYFVFPYSASLNQKMVITISHTIDALVATFCEIMITQAPRLWFKAEIISFSNTFLFFNSYLHTLVITFDQVHQLHTKP